MKRIKILLTGLVLTIGLSASAQDAKTSTSSSSSQSPSQRGLTLSVGPEFVVPIGTFRSESHYKFGIGGSAKLVLPLSTNFDGSISAGYIGFAQSKFDSAIDKNTFITIPFKAGIRYRTNGGFYAEPQVGYTQTKISNQEGSGQFTYAFGIGYLLNNIIDLSVRYEAIAAKDQTIGGITEKGISAKMLGLRLAYNFNFAKVK